MFGGSRAPNRAGAWDRRCQRAPNPLRNLQSEIIPTLWLLVNSTKWKCRRWRCVGAAGWLHQRRGGMALLKCQPEVIHLWLYPRKPPFLRPQMELQQHAGYFLSPPCRREWERLELSQPRDPSLPASTSKEITGFKEAAEPPRAGELHVISA